MWYGRCGHGTGQGALRGEEEQQSSRVEVRQAAMACSMDDWDWFYCEFGQEYRVPRGTCHLQARIWSMDVPQERQQSEKRPQGMFGRIGRYEEEQARCFLTAETLNWKTQYSRAGCAMRWKEIREMRQTSESLRGGLGLVPSLSFVRTGERARDGQIGVFLNLEVKCRKTCLTLQADRQFKQKQANRQAKWSNRVDCLFDALAVLSSATD